MLPQRLVPINKRKLFDIVTPFRANSCSVYLSLTPVCVFLSDPLDVGPLNGRQAPPLAFSPIFLGLLI